MHRRSVFAGLMAAAALVLSACASAPEAAAQPAFQSERIIVTTRGQGPDVILIHGMGSHTDVWDTTVAALEGRYRVHLIQISGFGGFPARGNVDGPVAAPVAEEIARYITEARLQRPAVIGHSMGGTIGMMLTARHPDLVGRLMVVDMFPFLGVMFAGPSATPQSVGPIADQIRGQMARAEQGVVTPMLTQTINGMVRTEAARPRIIEQSRASIVGTVANSYHELIVTDLRPELSNIRAPVTVLYVIPPQMPITPEQYEGFMRASYTNLAQARLVRIDNAYHFIMTDQFDAFMGEVNTFLAG